MIAALKQLLDLSVKRLRLDRFSVLGGGDVSGYWCKTCSAYFKTWEDMKTHLGLRMIAVTEDSEPYYQYDRQQDNRNIQPEVEAREGKGSNRGSPDAGGNAGIRGD